MPVNPFETYSPGPSGSTVGSFAITPSNGADLPSVVRAVVVAPFPVAPGLPAGATTHFITKRGHCHV